MLPEIESQRVRDLLLHKLSTPEAEALAERVIVDAELADQLEAETTDLLDDYARGDLGADDATRVETYLLADAGSGRRLRFARALNAHRESGAGRGVHRQPRAAYFAWAVAACLVLTVGVVLYSFVGHGVNSGMIVKVPGATPVPPGPNVSGATPEAVQEGLFTIALLLDQVRGEAREFVVPANVQRIRLECQVPLNSEAAAYKVIVEDEAGGALLSASGLRAERADGFRYVAAVFTTGELHKGRYSIVVETADPVQRVASFGVALR